MQLIDRTAIIDPGAGLGRDVRVGPYAIIGPEVTVGDDTEVQAHAVLEGKVSLGEACRIGVGAVIGGLPQDVKYEGEPSSVCIGSHNDLREYVTIHRATGEGQETVVGDNNMIMAYAHVGHNCRIGDGVIMANMVNLGGHVLVEDRVVIGGLTGVHQFVRIGCMSMTGGASRVIQDIAPYMLAEGHPTKIHGLNSVGLRRNGVSLETRLELKKAYKLIFRSGHNLGDAMRILAGELQMSPEMEHLLSFLKTMGRGICRVSRAQPEG